MHSNNKDRVIIAGELNARHTSWGNISNPGGKEVVNFAVIIKNNTMILDTQLYFYSFIHNLLDKYDI